MRPVRIGPIGGVVGLALALAALLPPGAARAAGPDTITGFGPFQFGMSVAEALHAVPRGRLIRCVFPDHFKNCVEYDDKALGMPATVRARFGTDQKLDAVFVQFDQLGAAADSQACRKTAVAALGRLRDEYGPSWQPKGASADLLRTDAKGAAAGKAKAGAKDEAKTAPKEAAKNGAAKPGAAKDAKGAAGAAPANDAAPRQDLFVWFPAKSGKIGLVDLCAGADAGMVYVIFTPSSVPGRKAS